MKTKKRTKNDELLTVLELIYRLATAPYQSYVGPVMNIHFKIVDRGRYHCEEFGFTVGMSSSRRDKGCE
jgi:hypothetical protein